MHEIVLSVGDAAADGGVGVDGDFLVVGEEVDDVEALLAVFVWLRNVVADFERRRRSLAVGGEGRRGGGENMEEEERESESGEW